MIKSDVIVGLQHGDEGKGKIAYSLMKDHGYLYCVRFNGGPNAGHTIYHKGKKFITHHIPQGVFHNIPSIIGPGCVLDVEKFFNEVSNLEKEGIHSSLIKIDKRTHVIMPQHREEDSNETKIGTTRRGIGPAYRDKFARTGLRAEHFSELRNFVVDFRDIIMDYHYSKPQVDMLFEGAQGFYLDIDHGDYPYVSSSHATTGGAILTGIPPQSIRRVFGVAKCYETYVGAKKFQPDYKIFEELAKLGNEYGSTTGRLRQCNWTNIMALKLACAVNGVTDIVFNKIDVLRKLGKWPLMYHAEKAYPTIPEVDFFSDEGSFLERLSREFSDIGFYWSDNPNYVELAI